MSNPNGRLTTAELELVRKTGCIHVNKLLLSRIKAMANQPGVNSTINKLAEDKLWELVGGKPAELGALKL